MDRLRYLSVKAKPSHTVCMLCTAAKTSTAKTPISSTLTGGNTAREKRLICGTLVGDICLSMEARECVLGVSVALYPGSPFSYRMGC